jgi:hypothetical protein
MARSYFFFLHETLVRPPRGSCGLDGVALGTDSDLMRM